MKRVQKIFYGKSLNKGEKRKYVNKKFTALFLAAVMGGSLCADMTVFAEEATGQEAYRG